MSLFLLASVVAVPGDPAVEPAKLLPPQVGQFRQLQPVRAPLTLRAEGALSPETLGTEVGAQPYGAAESEYESDSGDKFLVEIVQFKRDTDAYSLLTKVTKKWRDKAPLEGIELGQEIGTAGAIVPGSVAFFKGTSFVRVSTTGKSEKASDLTTFARLFADRIDKGDGDIPVLVKHLPEWQQAQKRALYLASFTSLKEVIANQPVLDGLTSGGDADAVAAAYGTGQLIIIEFNTPQLAADNDRRINARLLELRNQGQPASTAYRRVGNYSVFVFNGQNEQAANLLIDQIKYEQVVQWLGDNPYLLEKAQREFTETTLGVFVSVVKASGLALVSCFAIGGFFGALLFVRRRARQKSIEAFSDAGGMLRLNLDELTPQTDPGRLIGPGH